MVHVMSEVKTLATLILGGAFDATELSDNDIEINNELADELQQQLVTTIDDIHIELVARSDFDAQRLRADTAEAELARLEDEFDTLENTNTTIKLKLAAAEQRIAELVAMLREGIDAVERLSTTPKEHNQEQWVDLHAWTFNVDAALNPNPEAESHELTKG